MSTFPTSIPSYAGFTSSHTLSADNHASQHNSEQADIVAIATKVGTGSSTPTSGMVLRGNGAGTSAWAQVNAATDMTGTLAVANGGTGTTTSTGTGSTVLSTSPTINGPTISSPTISTPAISNPTMTSGGSWAGSPTIITPTIADHTNAQHNHQNAAGGGTLTPVALSNPYKFHVSRTAAANTGNGSFATVAYDTEQFDTNNNVSAGVFTATVPGFYQFNWQGSITPSGSQTSIFSLFLNGNEYSRGTRTVSSSITGSGGSDLIQIAVNDTVDIRGYAETARPLDVGATNYNYFSGFLVSTT